MIWHVLVTKGKAKIAGWSCYEILVKSLKQIIVGLRNREFNIIEDYKIVNQRSYSDLRRIVLAKMVII